MVPPSGGSDYINISQLNKPKMKNTDSLFVSESKLCDLELGSNADSPISKFESRLYKVVKYIRRSNKIIMFEGEVI